jgi:hypothetical protein
MVLEPEKSIPNEKILLKQSTQNGKMDAIKGMHFCFIIIDTIFSKITLADRTTSSLFKWVSRDF